MDKKIPKTMSKTNAEKLIGQYISTTKSASSHIMTMLYGEGATQVRKSELLVSKEDIMFHFGLFSWKMMHGIMWRLLQRHLRKHLNHFVTSTVTTQLLHPITLQSKKKLIQTTK